MLYGGRILNERIYLTAIDIQEKLGISRSKAYQVIKGLNQELEQKGYLVINGKVSKRYFEEKFY